jgi:hypothetical protein
MPRSERADIEGEANWEAPRRRFGAKKGDDNGEGAEHALLPVRHPDGRWQQRSAPKKAPPMTESSQEEGEPSDPAAAIEQAAVEVESAAQRRAKIAQLSASIVEAPHKNVGMISELHQCAARDASPSIRRLALLSAAAALGEGAQDEGVE